MSGDLANGGDGPRGATKEWHPAAQQRVNRYGKEYTQLLAHEAEVQSQARGDEVVVASHVEDAKHRLGARRRRQVLWNLLLVVAGGVFGSGFQGFFTERGLSTPNIELLTFWAICACLGLAAAVAGCLLQTD